MIRESAGVQWQDKIELAVHTGNVGSPFRKKLARAAEQNADTMLVNELFIGDHGKIKKTLTLTPTLTLTLTLTPTLTRTLTRTLTLTLTRQD